MADPGPSEFVKILDSSGAVIDGVAIGVSQTDDTAFTPAASTFAPIGAFADETSPDSVDEGDAGVLRMTLARLLIVAARGAPSMANGQVSVTSTATQIVAARATRRSATLVNTGSEAVWVGVATVTTANGVKLAPDTGQGGGSVTMAFTGVVQGITASGTVTVAYFEEYD